MNPNIEFELFTKRVYQKLKNNEILKPTDLKHDVKMKGASGCEHQIDVYWEYEKDGRKYRFAIECKNYYSKVSIGRVRDFFGVLYDLGNVQGIMVSANGFQTGAKKFAKQYGIKLKELSKPAENEVIGGVVIAVHADIKSWLFLVDEEWAAQKGLNFQRYRKAMAFVANQNPEEYWYGKYVSFGTKDGILRNSSGQKITSLKELEKQIPNHHESGSSYVFKYEDAWIESLHWGSIKIKEVKYEIETEDKENVINLFADEFVEGILKDAVTGKMDYVPKY